MAHMLDIHRVTCMDTRYSYPRKKYPQIPYYIYNRTRGYQIPPYLYPTRLFTHTRTHCHLYSWALLCSTPYTIPIHHCDATAVRRGPSSSEILRPRRGHNRVSQSALLLPCTSSAPISCRCGRLFIIRVC
jgi:hypothetical protein